MKNLIVHKNGIILASALKRRNVSNETLLDGRRAF